MVRHELSLPAEGVERARRELLDRTTPDRAAPFRWGYLLGVESDGSAPPAARALDRELGGVVGRDYSLSFLKTATGRPPPAEEGVHFEGFHLDTHPRITTDNGIELARILFNLAATPRRLRVARIDRFELARRGLRVPRGDYQVVELPDDAAVDIVEIPGREPTAVYALHFWASVVPHVGADDADGHFLASYEAVAAYPAAT